MGFNCREKNQSNLIIVFNCMFSYKYKPKGIENINKEYLIIGEAAIKFGVSVCTMRRWGEKESMRFKIHHDLIESISIFKLSSSLIEIKTDLTLGKYREFSNSDNLSSYSSLNKSSCVIQSGLFLMLSL